MPLPLRSLTRQGAADVIAATAAAPGDCAGQVGLELELFPAAPHDAVVAALSPIDWPGGSRLTFEPGGQVELSGPCLPSARAVCDAMAADLAMLDRAGVATTASGLDPRGGRPRVLDAPRYRAMEAYFDADGPHGRRMMRDTAALQVNVDAGGGDRWRLAHALGPVLAAAFANSPAPGWKSARLRTWLGIDQTRAAPVGGSSPGAWVDYALAAKVMFIRCDDQTYEPVTSGMTLADWVDAGHPLGHPTAEDVAYHLTTLFPPVRPRGWLELRFLDALPSPWWQAAAAATARLFDDPAASAVAAEACRGTERLWAEAARDGVAHPVLGAAAAACLDAVPEAAEFVDRYTARGRCPADDAVVHA